MIRVNPRLLNLKPYKVASHKIWSVPADERGGILKLDWNEATVAPSPKVKERFRNCMQIWCAAKALVPRSATMWA